MAKVTLVLHLMLWIAVILPCGSLEETVSVTVNQLSQPHIDMFPLYSGQLDGNTILPEDHPVGNSLFPVAMLTVREPVLRNVHHGITNCSIDNDQYQLQDYNSHILVILQEEFDYESQQHYNFTLTCQAPGGPSASRTFPVYVQDVDEYSPQIVIYHDQGDGYYPIINENEPSGTLVRRVAVFDEDSGPAGQVTCSLDNDRFTIHEVFANEYEIFTADEFDYEVEPNVSLTLRCDNPNLDTPSASKNLVVKIGDLNDNQPRIMINSFREDGRVALPRDPTEDFVLAHVAVFDKDMGGLQPTQCEVLDTSFSLQPLYTHGTYIIVVEEYNGEDISEITVECRDLGFGQSYTVVKRIHVDVIDDVWTSHIF